MCVGCVFYMEKTGEVEMRDIVLNERAKAEALLAGTGKVEDLRTAVSLIARYDVLATQIPPDEAAAHVKQIVKGLFPDRHLAEYESYVDYCVNHAENRPLIFIDSIPITQKELGVGCSCEGIRAKCLAFSLLAVAKFETMSFPPVNYWVKQQHFHEVIHRANLSIALTDMADMCHPMYVAGKVEFPKRFDSCSLHVLYADPDGEPVMKLNEQDYRDLGYCLRAYLGEKYTRCQTCHRWVKQAKNGSRRFCNDCAADNHRAINNANMRRRRA